ncbi:MAG: galactose oxidase-like domain-containing protein [Pseudomonadota bacterium]
MQAVTSTSVGWNAQYFAAGGAQSIPLLDLQQSPLHAELVERVQEFNYDVPFWAGGLVTDFAARYSGSFDLDSAQTVNLFLQTSSAANIYVDGNAVLEVVCDVIDGGAGPCPATGGSTCFCNGEDVVADGAIERTVSVELAAGTHAIEVVFLEYTNGRFDAVSLDWSVGTSERVPMIFDGVGGQVPPPPGLEEANAPAFAAAALAGADTEGDGEWSEVMSWPIIAIHSILTPDGKIFSYGTDLNGQQGATLFYDVWTPETGTHNTLTKTTATDIFCSAPAIVPATDEIIIIGGDARPLGQVNSGVPDVNTFDYQTQQITLSPDGSMSYARWYPTVVTLASGKLIVFGGKGANNGQGDGFSGQGIGMPELYTPGAGWKEMTGAESNLFSEDWWYPRAWLLSTGMIMVFGGQQRAVDATPDGIFLVDPAGNGSIQKVGDFPAALEFWYSTPAIMYAPDLFLIQDDSDDCGLWKLDMTSGTPVVTQVGSLGARRLWSDMTVLADGTVMVNGGSRFDNVLSGVRNEVAIWDPTTDNVTVGASEGTPRLYHSTSILLHDGRVLSAGGGAPGPLFNTNAEIYAPAYLFNPDGSVATRPVITGAPNLIQPRGTFQVQLDDAADINRLVFVKNGSVTHSLNMESRAIDLPFTRAGNTLTVTPPANSNVLTPGYWMLFAWNGAGTPSIAASIKVAIGGEHYVAALDAYATSSGDASELPDGSFQLTPDANQRAGTVMLNAPQNMSQSFTFTFDLFFGTKGDGADGITFVLHADPSSNDAVGARAGAGIANGFGIDFDTFDNRAAQGDIAADHTNFLATDGSFASTPFALPDLEDGAWHSVAVVWDAPTQTMAYSIDGVAAGNLNRNVVANDLGGATQAYLGFVATTGGRSNEQRVRFVSLQGGSPVPGENPPPGGGAGIDYATFAGATGLSLNGSAALAGDRLQLTSLAGSQAGSAFVDQTIPVAANTSFSTAFTFQITGDPAGGDGIAFVLQNAPAGSGALGGAGGDVGLRPAVTNSLAVVFDTYKNWWDRPGDNRLVVVPNGDVRNPLLHQVVATPDFNGGGIVHAWIDYDGASDQLQVFVATTPTKPGTPALTHTVDLAALLGGPGHAGFTAGTGAAVNSHEVLSWQLTTS